MHDAAQGDSEDEAPDADRDGGSPASVTPATTALGKVQADQAANRDQERRRCEKYGPIEAGTSRRGEFREQSPALCGVGDVHVLALRRRRNCRATSPTARRETPATTSGTGLLPVKGRPPDVEAAVVAEPASVGAEPLVAAVPAVVVVLVVEAVVVVVVEDVESEAVTAS